MNAESTVHTRKTKWKKVSPYRRRKFTKALSRLFGDTDLLQKKLAVELEVTDALISYYLNGTRAIPPDHLFAMCIALHLDTHTQRQLFDILDWPLPDDRGRGTEREVIIRRYMDTCENDTSVTVRRCNKELRKKNMTPLTDKRGKRNG